jgi:hypothetical protein
MLLRITGATLYGSSSTLTTGWCGAETLGTVTITVVGSKHLPGALAVTAPHHRTTEAARWALQLSRSEIV